MAWRLGLDLGSNSLGWAAIELSKSENIPLSLIDAGSRIFSDGRNPKSKQSNAADRREPRSARRNRDRYILRRTQMIDALIKYSLMPSDKDERKALEGGKGQAQLDFDPWILRSRALKEEITPYQAGRALFHLQQRRGFKSNRKADKADNEKGKVKEAIRATKEQLEQEGAKSLGDLFGSRRLENYLDNQKAAKGFRAAQPVARVRKSGEGSKWQYAYYPTRELILDEFNLIWESQKAYHPSIFTQEAYDAIFSVIEFQRPLKPQPVGKCTLMPEHERAAKALPFSQRVRIFQEVNNLRIMPIGEASRPLTIEERNEIIEFLLVPSSKTAKRTFSQIRKKLKLSEFDKFNLESEKRKDLQGDLTAATLMQEELWGKSWFDLSLAEQDIIVDKLLNVEDEKKLINWLCEEYSFEYDQAERIANCSLPDGHGNLSQQAIEKILPFLEAEVIVYSQAVEKAGMNHSQFSTGEIYDQELPYYGEILTQSVAFGSGDPEDIPEKRYGKVANPTVHVALNQLRKVINDLIKRYGAPEQIVLELSRDLPLSAQGKSELDREQKKNQERNERFAEALQKDYDNQPNNYENRLRLRLFEEMEALGRYCIYTGEQINKEILFSSAVEIEHILPFSRTLDDGIANKTLSMRKANRDKGNKTPYEAFGHSPENYDWNEIAKRAAALPQNKSWRFSPDAMKKFDEENKGFLSRQLTDTQYISRLAKQYVEAIYGGAGYKGSENNVWVITGRLTSDLRHIWGLNSILLGDNLPPTEQQKKNREDHRHHAIDAVVIACTDRSMLQQAAKQASKNEQDRSDRLLAGIEPPWDAFREDVKNCIQNVIVSHKPDHGFQGAMHNDTAYGIPKGAEGKPDKKGVQTVVTRKPLDSFEKPADLEKIRDYNLKLNFLEATQGLSGKAFKEALSEIAHQMNPPVYKVRIEEKLKVIPMQDKQGKTYKAYKGDSNYCYDIWQNEKGKWTGQVISTYQAYQLSRKNPDWWQDKVGLEGQALQLRIRKGDYLQIEHNDRQMIVQVYKFSDGQILMAEHMEANVDARVRAKDYKAIQKAPTALQAANAKRVTVSPSGLLNIYSL